VPFDANDPDTKAAIAAAIADANAGLDAKHREVLDELKSAKAALRKTQEISPDDLAKLESENEKLRSDLTIAQKAAKEAATASDKASKAYEAEQKVTHRLIAENGLVEELTKAGVTDPAYLDACKALHIANVAVIAEGDTRKALYGDKPLADAIKEWTGSDIGKRFVAAPVNGGGGAQGGGGESGAKTVARSAFDAMDHSARAAFAKSGGKVVDEAA
jgi:hypothetical protein